MRKHKTSFIPPRVAEYLLKKIYRDDFFKSVGDFEEIYGNIAKEKGILRAKLFYWFQIIISLRAFISGSIYWNTIIFFNYFKVAFRNVKRQKIYSFINITGLSVGITITLLILLWISDELSYDRFHNNSDSIYRVIFKSRIKETEFESPHVFTGFASKIIKQLPEVNNAVRFNKGHKTVIAYRDRLFIEEKFFHVDESVFDVFDFSLIKGDPAKALSEPFTVVLTEDMAVKYFGNEDPVGKTLKVNNKENYLITGILKNVPHNSHIKFDFLASFKSFGENYSESMKFFGPRAYIYLLIPDLSTVKDYEKKIEKFVRLNAELSLVNNWKFYLQPLTKIHLYSNVNFELEQNGDIRYVFIFSTIAVFILIIACMNFMNLSTARSVNRAKEVGVRKVLGACRSNLIKQFLGEAALYAVLSFVLAVFTVVIILPVFNSFVGIDLSIKMLNNGTIILAFLGIILFTGLTSGSYSSLFLSAFQPVEVMKGRSHSWLGDRIFRKTLVIIQFTISIFLIIGTLIINSQLNFIKNKRLGFFKENVVVIPVEDRVIKENFESFKNELLSNPKINSVSASTSIPSKNVNIDFFKPQGPSENQRIDMRAMLVDHDFLETFKMQVLEGRNFSRDFKTDAVNALIINESAKNMFGWERGVGKGLEYLGLGKHEVIGVVKDFHYKSKHSKIEPLVLKFLFNNLYSNFFSIKISPDEKNMTGILGFIESEWEKFSPTQPFEFFFLNESFDSLYRREENMGKIFKVFSLFAVFISCLGLFGLASFTVEQRSKEIGIRKILGAGTFRIVFLIINEFSVWIIISNILAWPAAYFISKRWLEEFAYRIDINILVFVISTITAFIIVLFSVGFQAGKAANTNPVDTLKHE